MDRHIDRLVTDDGVDLVDHRLPGGGVQLGLDLRQQRVDAGIGVAAEIPAAQSPVGVGRVQQETDRMFGIEGPGRPAQQVHVVVAGPQLVPIAGHRHGDQVDVQADPGQHAGDRGADLFVVDVAVVGAPQPEAEPVRVPGIGQQRPGPVRVEGQPLVQLGRIAAHARADQQGGRLRGPAHHRGDDRGGVDRVVDRLAHPHVLERVHPVKVRGVQRFPVVGEAQEDDPSLRTLQHPEPVGSVDAADILQRHRLEEVDLAGQQGGDRRRRDGNRREDHLGQVVLWLVPPVGIGFQHGADGGLAFGQAERAGAVGVQGGEAFLLARRQAGAVRLRPVPVHDQEVGDAFREQWVRGVGDELDRSVVDHPERGHGSEPGAHIRLFGDRPLVGELHVVGGEGRSVVEGDAFAQAEAPAGLGLQRFPRHRQRRLDGHVRASAHQPFIDVVQKAQHRGDRGGVRIHGRRIGLAGPAEGFGMDGGRPGRKQKGRARGQHQAVTPHGRPPCWLHPLAWGDGVLWFPIAKPATPAQHMPVLTTM